MADLLGWSFTAHAGKRIADRKIPVEDIIGLLKIRETLLREVTGKPFVYRYIGDEYILVVNTKQRRLITILLAGEDEESWQDAVDDRDDPDFERSMALLSHIADATEASDSGAKARPGPDRSTGARPARTRRPHVKPRSRRNFPVEVRNVFDGVPPEMIEQAKELLRNANLPDNDLRRVKRLSNGRLEIDLS